MDRGRMGPIRGFLEGNLSVPRVVAFFLFCRGPSLGSFGALRFSVSLSRIFTVPLYGGLLSIAII